MLRSKGMRSGGADLMRYLRRRRLKMRGYLLGDNLADMLRDGLHNFIGNVGVA